MLSFTLWNYLLKQEKTDPNKIPTFHRLKSKWREMSNLPGQSGLSSPHNLFQIDQIGSDLSGDAEVDCPVDNVEAEKLKGDVIMLWLIVFPSSDYHDGEDDSAVLVNITSSHAEDPVRGPGRGEGGQGQLDGLGVAVGWWVGGVLKHIIILQPAAPSNSFSIQ